MNALAQPKPLGWYVYAKNFTLGDASTENHPIVSIDAASSGRVVFPACVCRGRAATVTVRFRNKGLAASPQMKVRLIVNCPEEMTLELKMLPSIPPGVEETLVWSFKKIHHSELTAYVHFG